MDYIVATTLAILIVLMGACIMLITASVAEILRW